MNPFELTKEYLNRPTSRGDLGYLLLTGLVIGVAWLAILVWDWQRRRTNPQTVIPISLSSELMEAHRLTTRQIDCLHELARLHSLADPAMLFLDPRPWEKTTESSESQLSREARELAVILFGDEFAANDSSRSPATTEGINSELGNRL